MTAREVTVRAAVSRAEAQGSSSAVMVAMGQAVESQQQKLSRSIHLVVPSHDSSPPALQGSLQVAAGGSGHHSRQQQAVSCRTVAAAVSGQRRGRMWKEWILVAAGCHAKEQGASELSVERVELGRVLVGAALHQVD